jgi:diphthamide synthase (EF-2-diphthine--ammonia ligase)
MSCHLPLWLEPRRPLIQELLACGVRSTIVAVDAARLDRRFVGLDLTLDLVAELETLGIDACGEEGEYHTFVTAAPLFSASVPLRWHGSESRDGHWLLRYA